ncbi:oxidoreductase [Vibrio azureus]|uniref:AB hydrolase-1 domain-containing protein n=1 Tax=Vibrio azureus NBRC 104587 TaxID=1219077 RepID=U3ABV6_9VIBR|nr:alpha/beta hydrolase [Vibrio azureus]AUI85597.1 oxidoreductase [Vibrio azureus]GAD77401.1 hypothetical protein VAZ01S_073_00340 [Vibrio azureus NBRC 104587]
MDNKDRYLDLDGSSIYYEISGNLEGKPLLMLHGGLGSINELKVLHEYLAKKNLLISVDFRGHGKSPLGSRPLSYAQYQQDVQALLNHLGIEKCAIFGFSDGGIVGYRLAAIDPGRVSCLVTLGAQWRLESDDPAIELLNGLTADYWTARFADDVALYESINPQPDFPRLVDAVKKAWLDSSESGYPNHLVEQILCPMLVMRGEHDLLFSLGDALALKEKVPHCCTEDIPDTSHASHAESPELVSKKVQDFISSSVCHT